MEKDRQGKNEIQKRIMRVLAAMLVLMGIIVLRYGYVQLVQGDKLAARMKSLVGQEYERQSPRGAILDRNGRELAVSSMTKSLFIDPSQASKKDPDGIAADLAPLIGQSPEDVQKAIAKGGGFVWLKRFLSQDEYDAVKAYIREKELTDCLGFVDEPKRYYPNDVLAANVLGVVGSEDKGLDGVEQQYDSLIKGEVTESFLYTDSRSKPILDSIL